MSAPLEWHDFASGEELAKVFAGQVAERLQRAAEQNGKALLAVSGGMTPARFFEHLSRQAIDWSRVIVTLVDERFVPASSERSNARLVAEHLLINRAGKARFVGLFHDTATVEGAALRAHDELCSLPLPLDVAVLGMGADGHTASFFPDAEGLPALLSPREERTVLAVHARSAGEARLTLSLPVLTGARYLALHIQGKEKHAVVDAALRRNKPPYAPIRTVIDRAASPVHVYWAPD